MWNSVTQVSSDKASLIFASGGYPDAYAKGDVHNPAFWKLSEAYLAYLLNQPNDAMNALGELSAANGLSDQHAGNDHHATAVASYQHAAKDPRAENVENDQYAESAPFAVNGHRAQPPRVNVRFAQNVPRSIVVDAVIDQHRPNG